MTGAAPSDDAALAVLLAKIERSGLSVSSYKEPCLRRRLAVRMRARGVHTFGDYARLLDQVPAEYDLLLDALTINVTRFFRNPETYAQLRERVVPELAAQSGLVAVWSAGSATGEEPYSLAILFATQAGRARVRIDATDLDPGALAFMAKNEYPPAAVAEVPKDVLARWFVPGPPWKVAEAARRLVRPIRHDLTRDPPPAPPYHLIVCRNVVIYFDRPTQEKLFERFYEALVPGGWLVLGKVETLFGKSRTLFKTEDARERLFRETGVKERLVRVADWAVEGGAATIITLGLGSCVACILFDPVAQVGGLAHILLPSQTLARDRSNKAKFPDTAVPLLVVEMKKLGAVPERVRARLVGGAAMFANLASPGVAMMGERNLQATRDALKHARIPVTAEDTGHDYGRSVYFHLPAGRLEVKSVQHGIREL